MAVQLNNVKKIKRIPEIGPDFVCSILFKPRQSFVTLEQVEQHYAYELGLVLQ